MVWPEDISLYSEPKHIPGLAIWATNDRFFVIRLNHDDQEDLTALAEDARVLAEQIWSNPEPKLVREFKESGLPPRGEATGLFGKCKFRGQEQVKTR